MPTLEVSKKDLEKLVGKKLSEKEIEEHLMFVKGEIDGQDGDTLKVDVKETNRPDLWSTEGIAREIKARTGKEKGIPKYKTTKSKLTVNIEKSVKESRPFTVGAVLKGVKITDELLIQLIQLQEKVAMTFGRKRREAAIGVYDFDKIKGNIRYYGADPRTKKFVPLEFKVEMDLDEILEMHPKGKEYAHLLKGKKLYPVFEDAEGNVLSMPPVINSNYSGKVTQETKNLFVEVSGFNLETINIALNVMVMAIADRGAKIETVTITDSNGKKYVTPDFGRKKIKIGIDYINKITGLKLSEKEATKLLQNARYEVKKKGKLFELEYGNYRNDILHPIDVVEDILIGYGYNSIKTNKPEMSVVGFDNPETAHIDKVRDVCVGMGLQEVLTFTLTSKEKQFEMIGENENGFVEISNPVSANRSIFRKNIYPELLEFLSKNKHNEYPQKIFEVGKTIELDNSTDTKTAEKTKVCVVMANKGYGFTQIKSVFDAICKEMQIACTIKESTNKAFKEGKSAEIIGQSKGIFGELDEKTTEAFGIKQPVIVLEMEI